MRKRTILATTNSLLLSWMACPSSFVPVVQSQSIAREPRGLKGMKKHKHGDKRSMMMSHRTAAKLQSTLKPWQNQFESPLSETPKCFDDAEDATELGTLVLDSFWYEIQKTNCKPKQIAKVYDAYFRSDMVVNDRFGNIIADGLEEWKQYSIGHNMKQGSMSYICENQDLSFTPTKPAVTEPGIYDDFVWMGNEVISGVSPIIKERWYFIELLGASGSFIYDGKGKGSGKGSQAWAYEYHDGKGKYNDNSPHCHRPQIYGIVIFE